MDNEIQCLFFPSKESEKTLIDFLNKANQSIKICVYTFTNRNIVARILQLVAERPELKVKVITDDVQTLIPSQKLILEKLVAEGLGRIEVKLDISPASLMHNKYVILDDQYIATGSFNWTMKAVSTNRENLVLINDKKVAKQFDVNFDSLWSLFIKLGELPPPKPAKPEKVEKAPKAPKAPKQPKEKVVKQAKPKAQKGKKVAQEEEAGEPKVQGVKSKIKKQLIEKAQKKKKQDSEDEDSFDEDDLEKFVVDDDEDEEEISQEDD